MSQSVSSARLPAIAEVSNVPFPARVDRSFELPSTLYAATVIIYFAFLGIMTVCFMNPELALPMAVNAIFVAMAFGVAGRWAVMKPENRLSALTWGQFANRGVQTLTGRLTATEASVQVLILPVLILFWGLCIAVIVGTL